MRALIQRVSRAEVRVDNEVVGAVGAGLCALIGVTHGDDDAIARKLADRIWGLRIMDDAEGVMNLAVSATTGEVLVISQFTLYGDTRRGRRPSWIDAAPPADARPLVESVATELERLGATVARGVFGADMAVELVNDGPVTILLEVPPPA